MTITCDCGKQSKVWTDYRHLAVQCLKCGVWMLFSADAFDRWTETPEADRMTWNYEVFERTAVGVHSCRMLEPAQVNRLKYAPVKLTKDEKSVRAFLAYLKRMPRCEAPCEVPRWIYRPRKVTVQPGEVEMLMAEAGLRRGRRNALLLGDEVYQGKHFMEDD